ncbi:MAG: hypothetical protein KAS87_01540 [Candidatus Omnitrophica bacterium]|jgi:hypothetical protein|nr:hypothetical protein [Candidatus Omnitrophota bacterium]
MKGFCLVAVVVAMLMFYQKEPVYTLVIIGVGLFFYLFYKARKSGNGLLGTFMSGNQTSQDRNFDDLMALIMLQQLLSNNPQGSSASREISEESQKRREEINKIQREVLDLLDND